jgi:hypothetical protein
MIRYRVFTPEKIQFSDNAFNKEMTREPTLPDTTTEDRTEGFHPGTKTRNSKSSTKNKVCQHHRALVENTTAKH